MAEGFRIASAYVVVSPDTDGFAEELEAKVKEAADSAEAKVRIGGDDAPLDETIADARAKLDELSGTRAEATLAADDEDLDAKTDDARAKLDELDGKKAVVTLMADDEDLGAKTDEAKAKTDELDGKTATAKLGLDKSAFDAMLDEAFAALEDTRTESGSPKLGLDTTLFDAKMDAAEARLAAFSSQSASARLGASGGAAAAGEGAAPEGSMLAAGALGIGMLTPGIGAAATGLGLLGGTGALAFGGIASALSAEHSASTSTGLTGAQLASTNYSNTVQVQQAQEQVSQARSQAAEDAITSDQAIASADMNLAETTRNASASQIQAVQAVAQAKQGVQQADYGLTEAEYNLGQAYVSARENLQSLNDALADQKLNVQAAQLAVAQAEYNQLQVDQNAYSTDLNRQQAALAVAQAKQQVTDATNQESDAQTAANLANSQGVDGSQTVVQAKQAVTSAQQAQLNSVQSLQDAQRNLTNTELNNADQVEAAQMQVAQAQQQAAYTQQQNAIAVQQAEQNVTQTIKEQQLQMKATASTANQAANQYAQDMARLTPAGRAFVKSVEGLGPAWHGLESIAQSTVLPGMTVFLNGIKGLMPEVSKGVGQMGSAMSQAFGAFGKQMQTPAFAKTLQGLITNGIQFAQIVLPAFAGFFQQLAIVGGKSGAVTALADVLGGVGNGLAGFTAALAPSIPAFDQIGKAVGKIATAFGPALAQDIGLVAQLLRPIADLLNSKIGGPFVSGLAQVAAGFLTIKGLAWLLPDFITKPLAQLGGKIGGLLAKPFQAGWAKAQPIIAKGASQAASAITSGLSSAWSGISSGFGTVFGDGGLIQTGWANATGWASSFASSVGEQMSNAGTAIAGFASNMGSKMVSAGQSAVTFVAGLGAQLVTAAKATWTWVAENTAAGATYIAENIAEAAAATAAFIAENAATLGLAAVLTLLVGGVVYLATHWKQSWKDMEDIVLDVYHDGIEPLGGWIMDAFKPVENAALWLWHDVFDPMWHGIESGAKDLVSGLSSALGDVDSAFKAPVNFLINTVYDGGIRAFWNDIISAVGLSGPNLPFVKPLAAGGVIPGYSPGHDTVPALLSPGEGVLTPGATKAIGPDTVHALNAAHPPSGGGGGGMLGKEAGKQLTKHLAERPLEHAMTLGKFASGGIVGSLASSAWDVGKAVAALATGNATAFDNALAPMIGTPASGTLGRIMVALPKAIMTDAAKAVMSLFSGSGGVGTAYGSGGGRGGAITGSAYGAGGGVTSQVQSWFTQAAKLTGAPGSWIPPLETIGRYESGYDATAVNNTPAGIAAGTPEGVMQTIMSTFLSYHQPGTSMSIFDPIANIAAAIRYIRAEYGDPDQTPGLLALGKGQTYTGYDSGGWLQPGMTIPVNQTGRPEAVLTPQQSDAFVAVANRMISQQGTPAAAAAPVINLTFSGPQMPGPEQLAEMYRQLSLAVGG